MTRALWARCLTTQETFIARGFGGWEAQVQGTSSFRVPAPWERDAWFTDGRACCVLTWQEGALGGLLRQDPYPVHPRRPHRLRVRFQQGDLGRGGHCIQSFAGTHGPSQIICSAFWILLLLFARGSSSSLKWGWALGAFGPYPARRRRRSEFPDAARKHRTKGRGLLPRQREGGIFTPVKPAPPGLPVRP